MTTWADILRDPAIWIGVAVCVVFYATPWWIGKLWPKLGEPEEPETPDERMPGG